MNKLAEIIKEQITKRAYHKSSGPHNISLLYEDMDLVINGKKTKCNVEVWVEYTAEWHVEDQIEDYPGAADLETVDYWITEIGIDTEDGTIFTEEQEQKILKDNKKFLEDYIEEDVYNAAQGEGI